MYIPAILDTTVIDENLLAINGGMEVAPNLTSVLEYFNYSLCPRDHSLLRCVPLHASYHPMRVHIITQSGVLTTRNEGLRVNTVDLAPYQRIIRLSIARGFKLWRLGVM